MVKYGKDAIKRHIDTLKKIGFSFAEENQPYSFKFFASSAVIPAIINTIFGKKVALIFLVFSDDDDIVRVIFVRWSFHEVVRRLEKADVNTFFNAVKKNHDRFLLVHRGVFSGTQNEN